MKLKQFQQFLKTNKIQLVYLTLPDPNLIYFTQFEPSHAFIIITPKKTDFYVSPLDNPPKIKNINNKIINKNWRKELKDDKITKIGINKNSLTLASLDTLKIIFPKAKFIDISEELEYLRLEKTQKELSLMQKACDITSNAFTALLKELPKKKLKTEQDVAFFLEKYIRKRGALLAFPTIAAIGKNAAIPHHQTSKTKLKKGFLLIDFGAKYKNYCADMTRMVYLGTIEKQEEDAYNLLLKAQESAIKEAKVGKTFQELDQLTRKILKKEAKYFIHSLGHGIGIEVHEKPVFSKRTTKILNNIPFTIEPGIYHKGRYGLRIEDTVVMQSGKIKILTKAPKKLITIKI